VNPGAPQDLVGEQVADAGDPPLVHDPCLDRRRGARRQCGLELQRRDDLRIGSRSLDRRVEDDAAWAPWVDEHEVTMRRRSPLRSMTARATRALRAGAS
jgi:hypothetical protein